MAASFKAAVKQLLLRTLRASRLYRSYANLPEKEIHLDQLTTNVEIVCAGEPKKVKRKIPLTINNSIEPEFGDLINNETQKTFVIKARDWRVWGNRGAVLTDNNFLLKDVSREFEKPDHTIFKQFKIVPPKKIDGTIAVLAASGAEMYYHWMVDILPRINLLRACDQVTPIDKFILNYHGLPFQKESLTELGIEESKILRSNDNWNFHLQAAQLIVPSLPSKLDVASAEACTFLVETFLKEEAGFKGSKKIYLKRTGKRKIINELEIEGYLLNQGFEIIICDSFTIKEQALIFHHADIVAGPHGAAFTNIVFCKKGTKIIEFFSPAWINPCYWTISNEVGLTHYYLVGEGAKPKHRSAEGTNEDLFLDLAKLKMLMNKFGLN